MAQENKRVCQECGEEYTAKKAHSKLNLPMSTTTSPSANGAASAAPAAAGPDSRRGAPENHLATTRSWLSQLCPPEML